MLFDLRSRGRRRTVQGVYLFLAVLIGGGLIFLGVGTGGGGGGLLNGLGGGGNNSGNPTAGLDSFAKAAEQRVQAHPRDPGAWGDLVQARYQLANQGSNFNLQSGVYSASGKAELAQAAQAWSRYLALDPAQPSLAVARVALQAFGPRGLNRPAQAVTAAEVITKSQPRALAFFQLAEFAYLAHQGRKAQLAGAKAVELAPKGQRKALQRQLDAIRAQVAVRSAGGAAGAATPGAAGGATSSTTPGAAGGGAGSSTAGPSGGGRKKPSPKR